MKMTTTKTRAYCKGKDPKEAVIVLKDGKFVGLSIDGVEIPFSFNLAVDREITPDYYEGDVDIMIMIRPRRLSIRSDEE